MRYFLCFVLVVSASAQDPAPAPFIDPDGVEGAAGRSQHPLLDEGRSVSALARGSIFLVKGLWLGPEELTLAQPPYPLRLPDIDGGSRIEIRSLVSEEVFQAPLIHSWQFQLAAILPSAVPEGPAEVRVVRGAATSAPVLILAANSAPRVFSTTQFGARPAAAQVYRSPSEQPLIGFTRPARPGDTVILWANGLGPIEGDDNAPPVGDLRDDVRIRIAGQEIVPDYAGRAPGQPGLDQINFRLPSDADWPNHCYVPLDILIGSTSYGNGTISLGGEEGPCAHPWGLSEEALRRLDQGGNVKTVDLHLSYSENPDWEPTNLGRPVARFGAALAALASANSAAVSGASDRLPFLVNLVPPSRWFDVSDGCRGGFGFSRFRLVTTPGPTPPLPPGETPPQRPLPLPDQRPLQVGTVLVASPQGQSFILEPPENSERTYPPSTFWQRPFEPEELFPTPGEWTFRIGAGPDLGELEHVLVLPDLDSLPQPGPMTRGEDAALTWDGDVLSEADRITISVSVITERGEDSEVGRGFSCSVAASAGQFLIPGEELAKLPEGLDGLAEWRVTLRQRTGFRAFEAEGVDRATARYNLSRSGVVALD